MSDQLPNAEIAIIGMAGRFPGASDIDTFWHNLTSGSEALVVLSDEELAARGVPPAVRHAPHFVNTSAMIDDVELFDAGFFGYTPREAELMDPQQRIFLECAWTALEDAGYNPDLYPGLIGVYGGAALSSYLLLNLAPNRHVLSDLDPLQITLGNSGNFLTTRVSYKLNLHGPSYVVESACSTSLVAVHAACQSLLSQECDLALAGGISINLDQRNGYRYTEGGILSPDGHCRAFDAEAQGIVFGSGVGIVVLKRLDDALADGDTIHAVIKGSAVNNDGAHKVGYTAPSVDGQAEVILEALGNAGIAADTISYVEAHGTGTPLGDPIEVQALKKAFRASTARSGFCGLGSVKTNVGHLDAAAGVTGLIKTALALRHRQLPPSLNFATPNPNIDFQDSPFFVNTVLRDWAAARLPRRAGVSSFGMGGTNAHVILEEAPPAASTQPGRPWQVLTLSARSGRALEATRANLAQHLRQRPDLNLADVAYTLHVGRKTFEHRCTIVCQDLVGAAEALEGSDPRRVLTDVQTETARPVIFLFPGQGAQHTGMAQRLYQAEPIFKEHVDRCCALFQPYLRQDLRVVLYPGPDAAERSAEQINQTELAQPALFTIEYALAQLWRSWGLEPQALIGHSLGEYVAACIAGVFSLEDAVRLVAARGQLMQARPGGAMLSIRRPEHDLQPLLGELLSIAAVNSVDGSVVAGSPDAVQALEQQLAQQGIETRRLHTSHAFHSADMEPLIEPFTAEVSRIALRPPTIPFVSNVTGTWITPAEAVDPAYWARHLRATVRFADGLGTLLDSDQAVLLEVGPGRTLTTFAKQHPAKRPEHVVLPSLAHPQDQQGDDLHLALAVGQLWLAGVALDWTAYAGEARRQRVPLPTYPFERQRFWIAPPSTASAPARPLGKQPDLTQWGYLPGWQRTLTPARAVATPQRWLLLLDDHDLGAALARHLEQAGHQVVQVQPGPAFRADDAHYTLRPDVAADYQALMEALRDTAQLPQQIVHLWSLTPPAADAPSREQFTAMQAPGYYSLLHLTQALVKHGESDTVQITVVTNYLHDVNGDEPIQPEKATMLGLCKVIPQEYPQIGCRSIDLEPVDRERSADARRLDQLVRELVAEPSDPVVAYRRARRWVQTFTPVQLAARPADQETLRAGGAYLIVGGLNHVGLHIAAYLAQTFGARLVLTSDADFPSRERWDEWLATQVADSETARQIRALHALAAAGAEFTVVPLVAEDPASFRHVLAAADAAYGALYGVIHTAGMLRGPAVWAPIAEIGEDQSELQFQPKVYMLYALAEALQGRDLDFCLVCSSNAAILGGVGFGAYAAADQFMDAFAQRQRTSSTIPWISVNWDAWPEPSEHSSALRTSLDEYMMTAAEGGEALRRAVALATESRLIISTGALNERMQLLDASSLTARAAAGTGQDDQPLAHPRPELKTSYVAPTSEVEQKVAEVWQQVLGIEQIGIHDNFFDLGGHSLLATALVGRLRDAFDLELPLQKLFEAPTVAETAWLISGQLTHEVGDAETMDLLRMLAELSEEEVDLELSKRGDPFPII